MDADGRMTCGRRPLLALVLAAWAGIPAGVEARAEQPLRVGVTPIASIVDWKSDRPDGAMLAIWEELARRIGVETDYVRIATISELMTAVHDGTIDVALGPLAITEERERSLDLTHPVFHSGMRIAVRQRSDGGLLQAARSMVSWQLLQLLGGVLALALVSGHLLWWFERGHNPKSFPPEYPRGMLEAMWWIASTIITGGCDDKHVDGPLGRALAFGWMVGGIGLIAAFTSVLTATMTAERVSGTIHGPRDLVGRTVGVQAAGAIIPLLRQRGFLLQEFETLHEALDALALGMVEAVVSENQQLMYLVSRAKYGSIKLVGPVFESFDFGLGLPPGSPLREELNTAILRMREDGTLARLIDEWLGKHE